MISIRPAPRRVYRRMAAWRAAACLALAAAILPAPAGARQDQGGERIRVVATFSILADMVREVGGDRIALETIVGPNGDAHAFEPRPRDTRALKAAQVLVRNGLGFEGWLPRLLQASGFQGLDVVASAGVRPRTLGPEEAALHDHGHGAHDHEAHDHDAHDVHGGDPDDHDVHAGAVDPHAWQDLGNGVVYVRNIAQGLAAADPAHAAEYRQRADAYAARLQAEDQAWRAQLAAIPPARRIMMTSHDAFGYFGQAYGITLVSVLGLSSEAEPSAGTMARLIDMIRARGIHAIFLEKAVNPALMQRITRETGSRIGGTLYADALDEPGQPAGTYLGLFRWNTAQILSAFTE